MLSFFNRDNLPRLPERPHIQDKFSTFLTLDSETGRLVLQWTTQPGLKRNLRLYEQRNEGFAQLCHCKDRGRSVAQFWINMAIDDTPPKEDWEPPNRKKLALEHLTSYFEPTGYKAAKFITKKSREVSWEDSFYVTRQILYNTQKFLEIVKNYRAEADASLETYIQEVFIRNIKAETSVGKFSQWRLVCRKSTKELKEALERSGYREPEVSRVVFARKCFQQVYLLNRVKAPNRKTGEKWPEPELEDFAEAAKCYNAQRLIAPPEVSAGPANVSDRQIQTWMEIGIEVLRGQDRAIANLLSLEALNEQYGYEVRDESLKIYSGDRGFRLWESPEIDGNGSSLTHQINEKFKNEIQTWDNLVIIVVGNQVWPIDDRKILPLHYSIGLTQQQIAARCGMNQSTVNRKLSKYIQRLLSTLAGMTKLEGWVTGYVSNWLEKDFQSPNRSDLLQAALVEALQNLSSEERELLLIRYGEEPNEAAIALSKQGSETEVEARLVQAESNLQGYLFKVLDEWIKQYVKGWLSWFYKQPIYGGLTRQFKDFNPELKQAIELRYMMQLDESAIARMLRVDEPHVSETIGEGISLLQEEFKNWICETLGLSLDTDEERVKINLTVESWLQNLYKLNEGDKQNVEIESIRND